MYELIERIKTLMEGYMRNLVLCGLILLTLAFNCEAIAPVQLGGSNGEAILNQVSSSGQILNLSTNTGLLNWGNISSGYALNQSGILNPLETALYDWTPGI
jgi:hypothetical protein